MTDVPRRSFPLVVAPPGGFEDAVRRGRSLRRRRAGGTTSAALAIVGAIAWSTMGGSGGTSGLEYTDRTPKTEQSAAPGVTVTDPPTVSASPSAAPTGSAPSGGVTSGGGPRTDSSPLVAPPAGGVVKPPKRQTTPAPGVPFARRAAITETGPNPTTSTDTGCIAEGNRWCAEAYVQQMATETGAEWELSYTLCRTLDSTEAGQVTFHRQDRADFATRHVDDNDTVWTYSRGKAVVSQQSSITIDPGYCYTWRTVWDGFDDWGYTPDLGEYELIASSLGTASDGTLPTKTFRFTV